MSDSKVTVYTHCLSLTITCTCCCDEVKGVQDLKIYSHADSQIRSLSPQPTYPPGAGDQVLAYVGRAATVIQNSEIIAMKLTCAVQAADVNVDTMCVVNAVCATVVVHFYCGSHCALVLCAA